QCRYKVKRGKHGYKEKRKCRRGVRHAGGPPPWAPAHGYRRHRRGHHHEHVQTGYVPPFDLNLGHCNRAAIGVVLGGVTGGVIGSTIGRGDGRTAAIIGGTVLGAIVGGSIGRRMDQVDQNCVGQVLEHAPDGEAITWNTSETGSRHRVTPVKTYQDTEGQYCREYQADSVIGGRQQQTYGTACRQPDGSWRLVN
ncbi:MAG: RT0821/Lpp0805 family surface protein, partial [Gammaproteobacteria bacterium]